jgi:hypothetical protein
MGKSYESKANMTVLQVCSPGSHEGADRSLTRGVNAERGSTFNTPDRGSIVRASPS